MTDTVTNSHLMAALARPRPAKPGRRPWIHARVIALPLLLMLAVLVSWQAYVKLAGIPSGIMPSPLDIADAIAGYYPVLLQHAVPTTLEAAGGFLISSIVGVLIAVSITYSRTWREALYPNLVLLQVVPKIALAPLFILWLGLGTESRLAFSVFVSIFPVVVSTYTGFTRVDPNLIRLCKSFEAPERLVFFSVRLPSALPYIFTGMKVSVTMSMIGVVIGEFITAQRGLGYLIMFTSSRADTPLAMAAVAVLCVSGLLLFGIVALAQLLLDRRFGGGHRVRP